MRDSLESNQCGTVADPQMVLHAAAKIPQPWLKSYPENVPAQIPVPEYSSLGDLITRSFTQYAEKPAFTCMGRTINYRQLHRYSDAFICWLQDNGFKKGDRIAIMMPNILQYPIAISALLRAGIVIVNVNPLYTPRELEKQLNDAQATALIVLENFAFKIEEVAPHINLTKIIIASLGDMHGLKGYLINYTVRKIKKMVPDWNLPGHIKFSQIMRHYAGKQPEPVAVSASDLAFLQYTGGTTGTAKGAMLTHSNILSNATQISLWLDVAYRLKGKPEQLKLVCALPLYHVFALTVNAIMGFQQGGHNLLIVNPRDINAFIRELENYQFHIFPALNTLFAALMKHSKFNRIDFSKLLLTLGGGMPVQEVIAEKWLQLTHSSITEGYGLTETSPVVCANPLDRTDFTGTVGLPLPSTLVIIRDDQGKDLPLGEIGEVCVKGPQLMQGYWNNPDETALSFCADGFFRTGDIGFITPDGYLKIVDRKKDMILVSGFNVYPNEIEEVISKHPGIYEVAAIGIKDRNSGEAVKIYVVKKDKNLTEKDIRQFCVKELTGYKRPRFIEFRDHLPKSNIGKILRKELRDEANSTHA